MQTQTSYDCGYMPHDASLTMCCACSFPGIQVTTTLSFTPPVFNTGPGFARVLLAIPDFYRQSVTFELDYFMYPLPSITLVSPTSGPLGGGNDIRIDVREAVGPETREGAGLANFLTESVGSLEVSSHLPLISGTNDCTHKEVETWTAFLCRWST